MEKNHKIKRFLSYLWDIPLARYSNELNPELHLLLRKGQYQLRTKNAIYSYGKHYENFAAAIEWIGPKKFKEKSILLLGLGLASIPVILETKHGHLNNFTAIEKDADIIDMCSKYILSELKSQFNIYEGDAYHCIHALNDKYDIIAMDIFVDDIIPEVFMTKEFLQLLQGKLKKGGWLMYNVLYSTEEDIISADIFTEQFAEVFSDHEQLIVSGNIILLNRKL